MERIQALGSLAHSGSQVYASLLQLGPCNPIISSSRVSSLSLPLLLTRTQAILRHRHSGFKSRPSRKGRVGCSESSITETFSTQAAIEVVQSLEEAENQSLKAVSGDIRPEAADIASCVAEKDAADEDRVSSTVQAALAEILSKEESAETTQFHSLEYDAVMAAATKVADALVESDEVNIIPFPLLEPLSPMGAAMVTVWPEALEEPAAEEAEQEAEEVGFMVLTDEAEHFAPPPPPPEATAVVETEEEAMEEAVAVEEEPLLEPGAVASALIVKEVADALKADPEEDTVSHILDKETEVERLQGAEEKSLLEQLKDIVVFAGPALGIWLSGPIMGIIDTAVIGQSSSLELAALGKCGCVQFLQRLHIPQILNRMISS